MKPEVAQHRIEIFRQRFGDGHFYLACHAAFPLALTPDLLYRLWANFQRDIHGESLNIPWIAVSDLLLSNLCAEVGHELYEMNHAVRITLLNHLKTDPHVGSDRITALSNFLLAYVRQQLESHDPDIRDFAQTQRWTALAYTKPDEAAHELASMLSTLPLEEKAELVRIASLTQTLAEPLSGFRPLLVYTRGMLNFAHGDLSDAANEFNKVKQRNGQIEVEQVKLNIPSEVLTISNSQNELRPRQIAWKGQSTKSIKNIREETDSSDPSNINHPYPRPPYKYYHFGSDSDRLFNHLLSLRRKETPASLIERFRYLFIEGIDYPEPEILTSVHQMASSPWADREFNPILNRCCYILINYWWSKPELMGSTVDLVELLKPPYGVAGGSKAARQVRELVRRFTVTEQYKALQDRARTVDPVANEPKNEPIRNLIPRYPFLYPHCLLSWDTGEIGQDAVHRVQEERERQFEKDLNLYLQSLLRHSRHASSGEVRPEVENPTLLSPERLEAAVRKFVGKAEGAHTYRELAHQFGIDSQKASSYRDLKRHIYEYLTSSIQHSDNPSYGKHHFNRWLEERLEITFPQHDNSRPTSLLLMQTCAQLVEWLLASPASSPNDHIRFVDLNHNLGATFTIGLLLKIVLICWSIRANLDAIKTHMSKRFAVMLKHYESRVKGELEWLVECLENLLVAFAVHFGRADFSWVLILDP